MKTTKTPEVKFVSKPITTPTQFKFELSEIGDLRPFICSDVHRWLARGRNLRAPRRLEVSTERKAGSRRVYLLRPFKEVPRIVRWDESSKSRIGRPLFTQMRDALDETFGSRITATPRAFYARLIK